ncbi:PTS transporter subunit EIIA [Erysipelothrix sp. HDW6C]|uniref:BglG family transcription antiterminator n=1 Tax=Erysipelothrix sp. HDW6C TaxID=2714930 RepID=UPI00140C5ABD|nr:PTS sugar transporter subunit IIA [Erysipelothrix sp. HDW6C]QIK69274.1 PTS transporter subunit EIIA [Erysipelothrix sp. HDW6C]
MKQRKDEYHNSKILLYLLNNNIVTVNELSECVGLSDKTIRNRLNALSVILDENEMGQIVKKPRVGIWLDSTDIQKQKIMAMISDNGLVSISDTEVDITKEIKTELLKTFKKDYLGVTATALSQKYFISQTSVSRNIKRLYESFTHRNITIVTSQKNGMYLDGCENDFRLVLKEHICTRENNQIEEGILDFFGTVDIAMIKEIIVRTENEWGIDVDEISFNEILVSICIAISRVKYSDSLKFSQDETDVLEQYVQFQFTKSICTKIEKYMHIALSEKDLWHLSIQILCARFIESNVSDNDPYTVLAYDNKLKKFVAEMIEVVSEILEFDLTKDRVLYNGLIQHLRPLFFRVRYGVNQSNEMIEYIKNEYKHVFRATWALTGFFQEHYNIDITENELGYIAIYFEAALHRRQPDLKVVLVTKRNMSYTQLMSEKISRSMNFEKRIEIINYHDFNIDNLDDVDVILTTDELDTISSRIIEMNNIFVDEGLREINTKIAEIKKMKMNRKTRFDTICHQLFTPELIFYDVEAKEKNEVIKMMADAMVAKGYVTENYYQTVVNHERFTSTDIGNGVAIPHGLQDEINEAKVAIAFLNKPIEWAAEKVDVVFLLAVKMDTNNEITKTKAFYKQYIYLIESDAKINRLRSMGSSVELYNYLIG